MFSLSQNIASCVIHKRLHFWPPEFLNCATLAPLVYFAQFWSPHLILSDFIVPYSCFPNFMCSPIILFPLLQFFSNPNLTSFLHPHYGSVAFSSGFLFVICVEFLYWYLFSLLRWRKILSRRMASLLNRFSLCVFSNLYMLNKLELWNKMMI
jgi:hypothetical protein